MKNFKNFIFIGSNNLSKLLKEITEISTIKVTIYKESSRKTFIIVPHIVRGKQTSGKEIKITITDKEELSDLLNGIEIVSRGKLHEMEQERNIETGNEEYNINQKDVIILKGPPLCGKMFDFITETQGLFSNESNNLCATLQRNRFYATDGPTANSMHVLPISQFSRDALVKRRSSYLPKITSSDQEEVGLYPRLFHEEDFDSSLGKLRKAEMEKYLKLDDKRISGFETCLSEIFYDSFIEEISSLEDPKMTKNSKSSPAVLEVHEFSSNDQPRVKKSRVLVLTDSRFKKLENSFAKFQAKKKIRSLEPLLNDYDNKNEIMDELEIKFVDKFKRMQNTDKKKNLIVMNFDLPANLDDAKGARIENELWNSWNISKTYIDSLKTKFETGKKKRNRGNLVVVNDKIFKTSTNTNKSQNKHILADDDKGFVFLDNIVYKELEKEKMVGILNRNYSTSEKEEKETGKIDGAHDSPEKNNLARKFPSVDLRGYSEIPLDNLIAAVAEKKKKEYAARSKVVWDVYEHYEQILENTKILNPSNENGNGSNLEQKARDLSKAPKEESVFRKPEPDLLNENKFTSKVAPEREGEGDVIVCETINDQHIFGKECKEVQPPTLKSEVDNLKYLQSAVDTKSRIPVKVSTSPKQNTTLIVMKNDDTPRNVLRNDEKFISVKPESDRVNGEVTTKNVAELKTNQQKASINLKNTTRKSQLPRFVNPTKHILTKNKDETFLKLTDSEVDGNNSKIEGESTKEIEEFIDLKREVNQDVSSRDERRVIFDENEDEEVEVFSRKVTPNKSQLEFLQSMLKKPTATEIEDAKSNVEDFETVGERRVNRIDIKETMSHPKIVRREEGTFVITEPFPDKETHEDKDYSLPQKIIEQQKNSSKQKTLPYRKEPPTQKLKPSVNQPEKTLVYYQEKIKGGLIDEKNSSSPKGLIKLNRNKIDSDKKIEKKGRGNIIQKADNLKTDNLKTEVKNVTYKSGTTSKSIKNPKSEKAVVLETTVNGDNVIEKNEQKIEVQIENASKKQRVSAVENSVTKNKLQKKIKKTTNASEKIAVIFRGNDMNFETNSYNSKKKNESLKGVRTPNIKDKSECVNTKEKVRDEDKKKIQKEETNTSTINTAGKESKTIVNAIRINDDVIDETKDNNTSEKNESSKGRKLRQIKENFKKTGKNERATAEAQSDVKKSCNAEKKGKLVTNTLETDSNTIKHVIRENPDVVEEYKAKQNDERNMALREADDRVESLDRTKSRVEETVNSKIIGDEILQNAGNIILVENESPTVEIVKLAVNSFSNIEESNNTTEKIESEVQKETIKVSGLPEEEKRETFFSSELESSVSKKAEIAEISTDAEKPTAFIKPSNTNVESCSADVEENEKSLDIDFGASQSTEIVRASTEGKVSLVDNAKTEEISTKIEESNNCNQHYKEQELGCTETGKKTVKNSNDASVSVKEPKKCIEHSVVKSVGQNDKIQSDVSEKSACENVIIIKAVKKDSEETVESALGITKPYLEQIQSKMINFVSNKSKSKVKNRNFSFRSHAVKKCKEIRALLKKSQESLLEDNSIGLVKICQHAKMMNRFSRTKLPPKRLNGNTPKTTTTLLIAAADKSKQFQGKKVKRNVVASEGLVKSSIENKVTSKMKSLTKTPNDGNKPGTVRTTLKNPRITPNQNDAKHFAKLEENKDEFTPSVSICDLGKESIGSIFAEVVASALVKCGKLDDSISSDSQKHFTNIMDMAQDVKQKIKDTEICVTEEIEEAVVKEEMKGPNDFMIEGDGLRKLDLNVEFVQNKEGSADKYKCNLALVLNNKVNDEDVPEDLQLLKSETCGVSKSSEDFQQAEEMTTKDILSFFNNGMIEQNQEKLFKEWNEESSTRSMKDHEVNLVHEVHVSSIDNINFSAGDINLISYGDENNCANLNETKFYQNAKSSAAKRGEPEENETVTNKEHIVFRSRMSPISEKTNRDEQKGILTVEDDIKRHSFEFLHTQTTDGTAELQFVKNSDDTQRYEEKDLEKHVTIIKNNEEIVITVPNLGKTKEDIDGSGSLIEKLDDGDIKKNENGGDGSTAPVPDHLVRLSKGQNEEGGTGITVSVADNLTQFSKDNNEKDGNEFTVRVPDHLVRCSEEQNEKEGDRPTVSIPDHSMRFSKGQKEKVSNMSTFPVLDHSVRFSKGHNEKEGNVSTVSGLNNSVRFSKGKNEKEGNVSTVPVPDHSGRFSKGRNENLASNSKLKSSVGKPDRENAEISKIDGFQGLNRQNRNSAMKYLSYSDEYTKNTLDIFPEVFLTPFTSNTDLAKELDVNKGDLEENFGVLKIKPNLTQAASGMSKIIHIATSENPKKGVKHLANANDIRTSCNVNDFPNSKICRENDRSTAMRNYEYLKNRIEQDRSSKDAKLSLLKDELKAKKNIVGNSSDWKKYSEMSEDLKEAFAGLEKMGNSVKEKMGKIFKERVSYSMKEKTIQRETIPEKSSIRTAVGDYLQHQKRDFATKNPFFHSSDSAQNIKENLFPKNSTSDAKAQLGQMEAEVPEDLNEEMIKKPSGTDKPINRNVSRENSFYHELVRRSEMNEIKNENIEENDEASHNPPFHESFDEVPAVDRALSRRSFFENMDEMKNTNSKLPRADKFFQNSTEQVHQQTSTFGPIAVSAEIYKIDKSSGDDKSNQQRYLKIGGSDEKMIKTIDATSILEKKEKRPLDSIGKAVQYEPLAMEDLQIRVSENSISPEEEDLSFNPKPSQIPIRSSEIIPKHKILEKFASIDDEPGSAIYKIRRDLKFNSSTKRILKNAVTNHDAHKTRAHGTNPKSKGLSSQENATKNPNNMKHEHAKAKPKKMVLNLKPSKEIYSPPPRTNNDDLKRTLLKNPSKLLEIAGEIMDKNQYLNFLLDLKSKRQIKSYWWKKIYDGIYSSLRIAESISTKVKQPEKDRKIESRGSTRVKSSVPVDVTRSKSRKAVKAVKRESLNMDQTFGASRGDKKKERVGAKERGFKHNSSPTKPVPAKSVKVGTSLHERTKKSSTEAETDNTKSKSANLKSPKGNQMLKNDNTQEGVNRRNLSSQYRESTNFKGYPLPYTLKKFLETPDLIPKNLTIENIENEESADNFRNIYMVGEEIKMPKLKNTVACLGIPVECVQFNNTEGGDGIEPSRENEKQNNSEDVKACQELTSEPPELPLKIEVDNHGYHAQKDCVTISMLEDHLNETRVSEEEDAKPIAEDEKENEKSTSEEIDYSNEESNCAANIVSETEESDKANSFTLFENLNKDEGLTEIAGKVDIYVELNHEPNTETSVLVIPTPYDNTKEVEQSNLNTTGSIDIHLEEESVKVFGKATPGSVGSSMRDNSEPVNSSDFLSFPQSSMCSDDEECKFKIIKGLDHLSDVLSNCSATVSSDCNVVKTRKSTAKRTAPGRSGQEEILRRNSLFDDMCKSTDKLLVGAKQMGQMNFQTRRKFENPLSKFIPRKEIAHSGRATNAEFSQESITDTSVRADENVPKIRVVRTKSFSEVLKDDPRLLMRLREQKKLPSYVTPRRTDEVPKKFEYKYHDFRRKCDIGGKGKTQSRKKDFFEKFRDLMQSKKTINENNQPSQEEGYDQTKPKMISKILGKMKCFEDEEAIDSEKTDKKDGAATDRNSRRNFCNSLLLKSKFGSWRFVHTKMEHIDEDELMTWVQEHPGTPKSRSRSDNSKGDLNEKQNVIHVPWISSRNNEEEEK